MSATDPNRLYWFSGSTGIPGGPQTPDEGGPVLQNAGNAQGQQPSPMYSRILLTLSSQVVNTRILISTASP